MAERAVSLSPLANEAAGPGLLRSDPKAEPPGARRV